jgi:hypothetical protein
MVRDVRLGVEPRLTVRTSRRVRGGAVVVAVSLGFIAAGAWVAYLRVNCRAPFSCGDLASVHASVVVDPAAIAGSADGGLWAAADRGRTIVHINPRGVIDMHIPAPSGGPVIRISVGSGRLFVQEADHNVILDPVHGTTWPAPYGGDVAFWSDRRWWVEGVAEVFTFDGQGGAPRTLPLPGRASFRLAGVANGFAWVVAARGFGNNVYLDLLRLDGATGHVATVAQVSHTGLIDGNHPVLGGGSVWLGAERFDTSSRVLRGGERIGQFQLSPPRYLDHSDPTGLHCVSDQAWSPRAVLWTVCANGGHNRVARIRPGTASKSSITITGSAGARVHVFGRITVDGQGRAWFTAPDNRPVAYGPLAGPAVYAPGAPKPSRSKWVTGGLLVVAISGVLWWLWFVVQRARLRRRRRLPRAAAPTMDLGAEPPAVVNLLVHAGEVTVEAVPATLLDLAARRRIEVFQNAPEQFACRVRSTPSTAGDALLPYEEQVYDVVRDAAANGFVPVASLSLAMNPESAQFWNVFRARVRNDARAHGLLGGHFALHAVLALVPQVVLVAGLTAIFPVGVVLWIPLGLVLWLLSVVLTARGTARILSSSGREAASQWLGVRAFIARDDAFRTLPPAAVAIWDRYLAYAVAMDLAKDAASGLLLAFRTKTTEADRSRMLWMLRDPLGALAAMPADLRPGGLQGVGSPEPFGPPSDDFVALARGVVSGAASVAMELAAGVPSARQAELAAAVRARLDALLAAAPDEIHADAQVVHAAITGALGDALHDGVASREQLRDVGDRIATAMRAPEAASAWERVEQYLTAHGVEPAHQG